LPATTAVSHEVPPRIPESLMPVRLPGSAWAPRAALIAARSPLLSRLWAGAQRVRTVVSRYRHPRDAADFSAYRGAGRDLTDLVLQARIVSISGNCKKDDKNHIAVVVSIGSISRVGLG